MTAVAAEEEDLRGEREAGAGVRRRKNGLVGVDRVVDEEGVQAVRRDRADALSAIGGVPLGAAACEVRRGRISSHLQDAGRRPVAVRSHQRLPAGAVAQRSTTCVARTCLSGAVARSPMSKLAVIARLPCVGNDFSSFSR